MAQPMDPAQDDPSACFVDFYRREYRPLVKLVMAMGGTLDEAEEAVDETMADLWRRWPEIRNPEAYARTAVKRYFIGRKKRERSGLLKAVKGGHLTQEAHECTELTVWEDRQWVDQLVSLLRAGSARWQRLSSMGLLSKRSLHCMDATPTQFGGVWNELRNDW